MGCLSLGFLQNLLVWLVVVGGIYAIVKILLPYILGPLGAAGAVITQVLGVVMWIALALIVIYVVFALLGCLVGAPLRPLW